MRTTSRSVRRRSPWAPATALVLALVAVGLLCPAIVPARIDPLADAEDRLDPAAPALVAGVHSTSAGVRARVATAYGRIQTPECVDPLLTLLGDKSLGVRTAAMFSLGQLAWRSGSTNGREAEIADALTPFLGDGDLSVRLAAIEALGKIGLERTPHLVGGLLEDRSARVRAETLMALFRYRFVLRQRDPDQAPPDLPQEIVDRLPALAADKDTMVRRNVVYGFARFKDVRGLALAVMLSADSYEWTRFFALIALTKIADPAAEAAVAARLTDRSAIVRRAAVQAAAAIGAGELVSERLADAAPHVRSAVATAVGSAADVSDEAAAAWLRRLAADSSGEVRGAAVKALGARLKDGAAGDVLAAMSDADEYVRAAAVEAAASLAGDSRRNIVGLALADSSIAVRCALLALLAGDPSAEAFAVIRDDLDADEVDVRCSAITALAARKEPQALALGWRAYQDNRDARFTFLREAAVGVVGAFDNDASSAHLREMLADAAYPVAVAAYRILLGRGSTDVTAPSETLTLTFSPYRALPAPRFPLVTLRTTRGVIRIRCYRDAAPIHVANFVGLVRQGCFDGKTWQRVVPNFVIQGGSPSPLGWEAQTYMLRAEINTLRFARGAVGMSRGDLFNSGDSQLFITHVQDPHLDGMYTLFGQVVSGFDALDRTEAGDLILKASVRQDRARPSSSAVERRARACRPAPAQVRRRRDGGATWTHLTRTELSTAQRQRRVIGGVR